MFPRAPVPTTREVGAAFEAQNCNDIVQRICPRAQEVCTVEETPSSVTQTTHALYRMQRMLEQQLEINGSGGSQPNHGWRRFEKTRPNSLSKFTTLSKNTRMPKQPLHFKENELVTMMCWQLNIMTCSYKHWRTTNA